MRLACGDYELVLDPGNGGSVSEFSWQGHDLFRRATGPDVLEAACFPLVPFSNRIIDGRFAFAGRDWVIPPNRPSLDPEHPLHGYGWLASWSLVEGNLRQAKLRHDHAADGSPWKYEAVQTFLLTGDGLRMSLEVRNIGDAVMPCGLGFHPYFPRDSILRSLHRHEWRHSFDFRQCERRGRGEAIDWWHGNPVGSRVLDTDLTGREGPLRIEWPGRGIAAIIAPSENLSTTIVYTPQDQPYFCVEPVSHRIHGIPFDEGPDSMVLLEPGATMAGTISITGEQLEGAQS